MYRCIHCGSFTGETIAEVSESANQHGVGTCTSPCRYCNEGVKHAPHVCGNLRTDEAGHLIGEMSSYVRDFCEERGWQGFPTRRR